MATETLRPNAAGSETSIATQYPASTEHWDKVDEVDADDSATYVGHNVFGTWQRDLYNLPAHSGSGTINTITVYFRVTCTSTRGSIVVKPSIRSDTTVTDGTSVQPPESNVYQTFSQEWVTNPADGGAWAWADIDALQIGVNLYAGTDDKFVRCTQVYVEVDYTLAAVVGSKSANMAAKLVAAGVI